MHKSTLCQRRKVPLLIGQKQFSIYEMIIEMPLGSVEDGDGIDRVFTLVGLDSFDEGMRSVSRS